MKVASVFSIIIATQLLGFAYAEQHEGDGECAFQIDVGNGQDAKMRQMGQFTVNDAGTVETTNYGQRINNSDSLKVGYRGPTLMEDFMMREKIMHFGKYLELAFC